MSRVNNQQIICYLCHQQVPHAMIKILEEQRISNEDLQTIDRDDVEHLFKNEAGFTFRDRKQFWNAIQKFRSTNAKNGAIYIEQDDQITDLDDIIDDESPSYSLIPCNILPPARLGNTSQAPIQENLLELSSSDDGDDDDVVQIATTSLPAYTRSTLDLQTEKVANIQFYNAIQLPVFSPRVQKAFETNNIHNEWSLLVNELAVWIMDSTSRPISQREYQIIGKAIFKQYPDIAKDGFRPWSCLCKNLAKKIRELKKKQRGK